MPRELRAPRARPVQSVSRARPVSGLPGPRARRGARVPRVLREQSVRLGQPAPGLREQLGRRESLDPRGHRAQRVSTAQPVPTAHRALLVLLVRMAVMARTEEQAPLAPSGQPEPMGRQELLAQPVLRVQLVSDQLARQAPQARQAQLAQQERQAVLGRLARRELEPRERLERPVALDQPVPQALRAGMVLRALRERLAQQALQEPQERLERAVLPVRLVPLVLMQFPPRLFTRSATRLLSKMLSASMVLPTSKPRLIRSKMQKS